jgi:DNA-directed RNA polymerase omega subunit
MPKSNHSKISGLNEDLRQFGSIYRMVIVAGLRSKQITRGSKPRILPDPLKRRSVSIALEEVRRGLVPFILKGEVGDELPAATAAAPQSPTVVSV